jgi:hypothetical protein
MTKTSVPTTQRQPDRPPVREPGRTHPGPPRPLLGGLRRIAHPKDRGRALSKRFRTLLYVAAIVAVVGLGTWGFHRQALQYRLDWLQSTYHGLKLFTLDWGPAAGPGANDQPNWPLIVALVLAAAVIARAVWALVGDRTRRWITGHWLRDHVVICGAGVHGAALAHGFEAECDIVVVDLDPQAPGMQDQAGPHKWRILGDARQPGTLRSAGLAKAAWVVVITGDDLVNSQIVSTIATFSPRKKDLLVLVQVEDPSLVRFLEEDLERELDSAVANSEPNVISFSANSLAADWLLDRIALPPRSASQTPAEIEDLERPHLILAGDHPLLDAILLTALRRWRAKTLYGLERSDGAGLASANDAVVAPLRISLYGPGAVDRAARLERRWLPEAQILQLEAKDSDPTETTVEADEWLQNRTGAHQAFCACWDESDAITLTLGLARALGVAVPLVRIAAMPETKLDQHIKKHAKDNPYLANIEVVQLAALGSGLGGMSRISKDTRLIDALESLGIDHDEASGQTAELLASSRQPPLRTDSSWRVTPSELALIQPLAYPAPVSALVRARLALDLDSVTALRLAADRLAPSLDGLDNPSALDAFAAWCEYLRVVRQTQDRDEEVARTQFAQSTGRRVPDTILRLGQAALGDHATLEALAGEGSALDGAREVVILAGGADGLLRSTAAAMEDLLRPALDGYDGVLLSGGTGSGLPGIVGTLAHQLSLRAIGYLPTGGPPGEGYSELRETAESTEFSVLEPLGMWTDIFAARIDPANVRFIACPGGGLTYSEMLLARALGAQVAWLDPGAELSLPLGDLLPLGSGGILELPADAMTIRAFLHHTTAPAEIREELARFVHSQYRVAQLKPNRKLIDDPALVHWDRLPAALKESDYAQVDDIPNKLAIVGLKLIEGGRPLVLTDEQIEHLAEVEHGRYNVERLTAGWRLGDRHIRRLTSPHLKPWKSLTYDIQEYDREAVRNIGTALLDLGWGVTDA